MSASTYNSRADGNNQIFIDAVYYYLSSYIDGVTVLSVVNAESTRRSLRSSDSKEELSVPMISVTYLVIFSSNSFALGSVYSNIYYSSYYMQSNFPFYLNYYGSYYSYAYPNSFGTHAVTSSSLTSISDAYIVTSDDDTASSSSSKEISTAVIIAASVGGGGGCALLIAIGVLIYCFCRRKNVRVRVPVEETSGIELNHRAFEMAPPQAQSYPYPHPYSYPVPAYQGVVMQPEVGQKGV